MARAVRRNVPSPPRTQTRSVPGSSAGDRVEGVALRVPGFDAVGLAPGTAAIEEGRRAVAVRVEREADPLHSASWSPGWRLAASRSTARRRSASSAAMSLRLADGGVGPIQPGRDERAHEARGRHAAGGGGLLDARHEGVRHPEAHDLAHRVRRRLLRRGRDDLDPLEADVELLGGRRRGPAASHRCDRNTPRGTSGRFTREYIRIYLRHASLVDRIDDAQDVVRHLVGVTLLPAEVHEELDVAVRPGDRRADRPVRVEAGRPRPPAATSSRARAPRRPDR